MADDNRNIGEKMNSFLGLNPGFTADRPSLVDSVRDDIDDTTRRAQANLDQQRQNKADVEEIAAEIAAEKDVPSTLEPYPADPHIEDEQPSMGVPHLHEYKRPEET